MAAGDGDATTGPLEPASDPTTSQAPRRRLGTMTDEDVVRGGGGGSSLGGPKGDGLGGGTRKFVPRIGVRRGPAVGEGGAKRRAVPSIERKGGGQGGRDQEVIEKLLAQSKADAERCGTGSGRGRKRIQKAGERVKGEDKGGAKEGGKKSVSFATGNAVTAKGLGGPIAKPAEEKRQTPTPTTTTSKKVKKENEEKEATGTVKMVKASNRISENRDTIMAGVQSDSEDEESDALKPITIQNHVRYHDDDGLGVDESCMERTKGSVETETTASALRLRPEDIGSSTEDREFVLFQLPQILPIESPRSLSEDGGDVEVGTKSRGCRLEDLKVDPSSSLGKMIVYDDGSIQMRIGEVMFDVETGSKVSVSQHLVSLNLEEEKCHFLGHVKQRAVIMPSISDLVERTLNVD